jgi:hypothetical protein
VTTLCDTLESVLTYFRDADRDDGDGSIVGLIYTRLRTFKHIYCLYFLADILYSLLVLSRMFSTNLLMLAVLGPLLSQKSPQFVCYLLLKPLT